MITDYKVADANKVTLDDASGESPTLKLISSLPDRPADAGYTASELKALFDGIVVTYLGLLKLNGFVDVYNDLVDYLNEHSDDLSVSATGITATTIKTALEEIATVINTIKGDGWTDESIIANATAIAGIIAKYGAANGLATLNADGKIPVNQMNPEAVVEGTIDIALTARAYDTTFDGENSIKEKFDTKQDTLTIDSTPTESSTNPISSEAVHTALNGKTSIFTVADATITTIWKGYGEIATSNDLNGLDIRLNLTTPSAKTSGSVVTILAFTDNATDYITYQCNGTNFIITGYGIFAGISQTVSAVSTAITEVKVSIGSGNYTVATYDTTPDATNGGEFKVESLTTSGTETPFVQEVEVSGLTTSNNVHITPDYSAVLATALLQKQAWNFVSDAVVGSGKITFYAFEDKPTTAIPIDIEVM